MQSPDIGASAAAAAETLRRDLSPGPLAELRRMERGNPAPAFWRLAARYPATIGRRDQEEEWMQIVRILAILTPRGEPEKRPRLHVAARRLGTVLCDGGDISWPGESRGEPRPAYGEGRFGKLLESKGAQRRTLLTRAARSLARSMPLGSGVNVADIAFAILHPDRDSVNNGLARSYYARLDGATRRAHKASNQKENA